MHPEKLKQFRRQSIEKASRAGLPAYFIDECSGDGVIRVKPNGVMERIVVQQGQPRISPFACRSC